MAKARNSQISLNDTPYYHCISRCVRRAFLCGEDHVTGRSFEHRCQWIVDRLKELADIFSIDICAYAVMSNHYHVVLRVNRPGAQGWSDEEVIEHWLRLFKGPLLVHRYLKGETKTKAERRKVAEIVAGWRERLCDISWFMRCLNESLARKANVEDNCKGRFWEGRFKSQALLDEAAILTCMAYVDLNPVRADIAETPEASDYTSIQERIRHYADMLERDVGEPEEKPSETTAVTENPVTTSTDTLSKTAPAGLLPLIGNEHHDQPERAIAFSLQDYLALVDWTGRAIRDDKKGAIPHNLLPILQGLGLDEHAWADNVQYFGRRFHGVIGTADRVRQFSRALGKKWLCGVGSSRGLYRPIATDL